jgi:uncharacterized protein DUF222/HNH endonuclease
MLEVAPSTSELAQELVFLEHQISLLQLEASMLAAQLSWRGFLEEEGYNSPTDWLRFNCHLTDKVAFDRIRVGEHVGELQMSVDYLRDGEIGYAHLAHDDRLLPQRNADALVELASGGRPANVQVTATIETLKGLVGAAAGEMELSLPISSAAVQRMACDCSVTRVLLSQDSVAIDVGRTKRVMSGGLRRALKARDGHCQWPGCERSASLCHGHHLVHWIEGGPTTLGNLILLCHRHHRMVHEGGWQIVRCDGGQIVTIAPTITFGQPRAPDG